MQCACAILSSVACPALQYVSTLYHKRHDFRGEEEEEEEEEKHKKHKKEQKKNKKEQKICVLSSSTTFVSNISHSK